MVSEEIRAIPVWSGWVRLTHVLFAGGITFEMLSAWILQYGGNVDGVFWQEWHLIVGQLLLVTLAARVILMFYLSGSGSWRAFVPDAAQWVGVKQTLLFYASAGKAALPNWYAHNPLWKVVYPLFALVLLGSGLTGLLYHHAQSVFGLSVYQWHTIFASIMVWFTVLHILAVVVHDLKGKVNGISAMINGVRYFHIDRTHVPTPTKQPSPFQGSTPPVYIAVDTLKRKPSCQQNDDR